MATCHDKKIKHKIVRYASDINGIAYEILRTFLRTLFLFPLNSKNDDEDAVVNGNNESWQNKKKKRQSSHYDKHFEQFILFYFLSNGNQKSFT